MVAPRSGSTARQQAKAWFIGALPLASVSLLPSTSLAASPDLDTLLPVPAEIVFRREPNGDSGFPQVNRYERYGSELVRMDYKNPEYSPGNGPAHLRNRSWGAMRDGTMWMTFELRTESYFGSGAAAHIAIVMRGAFHRVFGQTGGSQSGRGLALFPEVYGGLMAENFSAATFALIDVNDGRMMLRDGVSYWFALHVNRESIAYWIQNDRGELLTSGYWADPHPVDGEGYGFAVLCAGSPNANCDFWWESGLYNQYFEVRFSHIGIGWF